MYQDPNYGGGYPQDGYPPQGPPQGYEQGPPQGYDQGYGGYPQGPPGYPAGTGMAPDPYGMPPQDPYAQEQAFYQQQMLEANMAEQADVQRKIDKIERKQAEKAQRDRERAADSKEAMDRKLARDQEDNQSCANMICVWGMINAMLWTGPLMGDDWYTKIMFGMGVEKLQITTGLFNMDTVIRCSDGYIKEDKICASVEPYAGHFALEQMMELMCKEVADGCTLMKNMFYIAHIPLVCLPISAALETLSVLLLYCYWHGLSSRFVRSITNQIACLAPCVGGLGFTAWMVLSPNMQVLPRMWCAAQGQGDFVNNFLVGLKETWTIPFGWCSWMVLFVWMGSCMRAFAAFAMLGEHQAEIIAQQKQIAQELREESKEIIQQELEEARYGATR